MSRSRSASPINDSWDITKFEKSPGYFVFDNEEDFKRFRLHSKQSFADKTSKLPGSETLNDINLKTSTDIDENVFYAKSKTNTQLDEFQQVQNEYPVLRRAGSKISTQRTVSDDRKEELEVPLEMLISNEKDPTNKEDGGLYCSEIPIRNEEEDRIISAENIPSKNVQSSVHLVTSSFSSKANMQETSIGENEHQSETYMKIDMNIPIDYCPDETESDTHNNFIQEDILLTQKNKWEDKGDMKTLEQVEKEDKFDEDWENVEIGAYQEGSIYLVDGHWIRYSTKDHEFLGQKNAEINPTINISTSKNSILNVCEENSENECNRKLSVYEIKQRFSCHSEKNNEEVKPRNVCETLEVKDTNSDHCTTKLSVSSVEKDSSAASFLCATRSGGSILDDDKLAIGKPKSFHSGVSNDAEEPISTSEGLKNDSVINKTPLKPMKERLISSCSDILEKTSESKRHTDVKPIETSYSFDKRTEVPLQACEKQNFNVSVKEIMKTYKCQVSNAHHNMKSVYPEEEVPTVNSIKELQSSFSKPVQENPSPVNYVNRSKVKDVQDGITQMQNYCMKCKSCAKQVFFMERVLAEKSIWHKKCFKCTECQKQLTVENYKSRDGELYCKSHYTSILKPKPNNETVSENSVLEEVKLLPLNFKPLIEKTQNITPSRSPTPPPSVQRSPKFLKRLAKFEGKYQGQSEDEEDNTENIGNIENWKITSFVKTCKAEDLECYLQGQGRTKSTDTESISLVKNFSDGFPESSTLQAHLKQFFEKSEEQTLNSTTKNAEDIQVSKIQSECVEDVEAIITRFALDESESKFEDSNSNEPETLREISEIDDQSHDVQYVISYFNQQQ